MRAYPIIADACRLFTSFSELTYVLTDTNPDLDTPMGSPTDNIGPDELLADTSNVDDLRAQRVWQLVTVAWFTWLFFTGYCWLRNFSTAAWICFSEVMGIWLIIKTQKRHARYRRAMNASLGACAVGILLVSISDPALHRTMLFYPVSILIASQLLGISAAFQWLTVNIVANTMFFWVIPGQLDELALIYGVGACVFFCCQQGEDFYRERTKSLVDLSQRLKQKAKSLHKLATTDSLTGLINRFQFQEELRDRVRHAVHQNERMALVLVDMDGFKEINDTLGHPVGDQARLKSLNACAKNSRTKRPSLGWEETNSA